MTTYAITYTDDVQGLNGRAVALFNAGEYHQYLSLNEDDPTRAVVKAKKIATAYAPDGTARSLSLCVFPEREIIGDPNDPDFVPFFERVGMLALAYGIIRTDTCPYKQIETGTGDTLHPAARALYDSVVTPTEILDEHDQPTGETRFRPLGEFDV